jgi:3D (Asp-Asp-Asp) domain-containing protein
MTKNSDGSSRLLTKYQSRIITHVLFVVLSFQFTLSPVAAADLDTITSLKQTNTTSTEQFIIEDNEETDEITKPITVPAPKNKTTSKSIGVKGISAYNVGDPYQTDDSPCTAANGEDICLALDLGYKRCASNMVPFGTVLDISGFGQCIVTDRMNSRYQNHVDIAFKATEKKEAMKFGRRKLEVKIIKRTTEI